jgi:hypothetical protein
MSQTQSAPLIEARELIQERNIGIPNVAHSVGSFSGGQRCSTGNSR